LYQPLGVFLKLLSFVRLFFVGEFSMMLKASSASMVALPNWRWLVLVHYQSGFVKIVGDVVKLLKLFKPVD